MNFNIYKIQLFAVFLWFAFVVIYLAMKNDYNHYKSEVQHYDYYIEWRNTIFQLIVALGVLHYVKGS